MPWFLLFLGVFGASFWWFCQGQVPYLGHILVPSSGASELDLEGSPARFKKRLLATRVLRNWIRNRRLRLLISCNWISSDEPGVYGALKSWDTLFINAPNQSTSIKSLYCMVWIYRSCASQSPNTWDNDVVHSQSYVFVVCWICDLYSTIL